VIPVNLNYLEVLVLYAIKKFRKERTVSAVYHLLKGKKSSQTIQDAAIFRLTSMFGLYPSLSREKFNESITFLHKQSLIQLHEQDRYSVTELGEHFLTSLLREKPIPSELDGWRYVDVGKIFWNRLSQFVQTVSHLSYKSSSYIPLSEEMPILLFVKQYIFSLSLSKEELARKTYVELKRLCLRLDERRAQMIVYKLTGYNRIGLTNSQLSEHMQEDRFYIDILFLSSIHSFLSTIRERHDDFPIFFGLIKDMIKQHPLTSSTLVTYNYLKRGYSVEKISAIRKLKKSTIEDHIVEIALNIPSFNLSNYVKDQDINLILGKIEELNTTKLKTIKESLHHQYSYFQIRLAIAMAWRNKR
jgi:uncharacterized protein YpbB